MKVKLIFFNFQHLEVKTEIFKEKYQIYKVKIKIEMLKNLKKYHFYWWFLIFFNISIFLFFIFIIKKYWFFLHFFKKSQKLKMMSSDQPLDQMIKNTKKWIILKVNFWFLLEFLNGKKMIFLKKTPMCWVWFHSIATYEILLKDKVLQN